MVVGGGRGKESPLLGGLVEVVLVDVLSDGGGKTVVQMVLSVVGGRKRGYGEGGNSTAAGLGLELLKVLGVKGIIGTGDDKYFYLGPELLGLVPAENLGN